MVDVDALNGVPIADFVRAELPGLNARLDRGEDPRIVLDALARRVEMQSTTTLHALLKAVAVNAGALSESAARRTLGALGFVFTSTESAAQAQNCNPGSTVRKAGAEAALLALAQRTGLPPYANLDTMWLDNPVVDEHDDNKTPLTLTGTTDEVWFHDSIRLTSRLQDNAIDQIMPIISGQVSLGSPGAYQALREAASDLAAIRSRYLAFTQPGDEGRWPISPEFFASQYRTKLVAYPVGKYPGAAANALYLPSQLILDVLLGLRDHDVVAADAARYSPHMARGDVGRLDRIMRMASLMHLVLEVLAIGSSEVSGMTTGEAARRLAAAPPGVQRDIAAYTDLAGAWIALSGAHWRLIEIFVIIADAEINSASAGRPVGTRSTGRSGVPLTETALLLQGRRQHPAVGLIRRAVRLARREIL